MSLVWSLTFIDDFIHCPSAAFIPLLYVFMIRLDSGSKEPLRLIVGSVWRRVKGRDPVYLITVTHGNAFTKIKISTKCQMCSRRWIWLDLVHCYFSEPDLSLTQFSYKLNKVSVDSHCKWVKCSFLCVILSTNVCFRCFSCIKCVWQIFGAGLV